jgi:hypothetical protein
MNFKPISAFMAAPRPATPKPAAPASVASTPVAPTSATPIPADPATVAPPAIGVLLATGAAVVAAAPPATTTGRDAFVEASQNLLKHIPGEASGFYLLAVDSIKDPSFGNLGVIFSLSFVLLVVVRWLAKASSGIMITTILAFFLWMLIFDKGFLHAVWPNLLPAPMGLIVAVFYSMLVTLLASAGKIR